MKNKILFIILLFLPITSNAFVNNMSLDRYQDDNLKVVVKPQSTRGFALRLNHVVQSGLTLAADTAKDDRTIEMSPGHGLVAGDWIILLEGTDDPNFFYASIKSVAVNTLTLDNLVPDVFTAAGTSVTQYDPSLAKNGSVTVYKAELKNPFATPIDITRLIFHITDNATMDDGKFGGLTALSNGVAFRHVKAQHTYAYWNVKTNGDLSQIAYDARYDAKSPAGIYGFSCRLTYSGSDKHDVVLRLEQGESVEVLIQDDLTGLSSFYITAEGPLNN